MEITSLFFVLLFFVSIVVYYLLNHSYRAPFLALISCAYIATFSIHLVLFVIFFSLVNYYIGIGLSTTRYKKALFRTGLFLNLGQLVLMQYASFAISPLLQILHVSWDVTSIARFIVPVGISFFTLQGIGYLVNIQMAWEKPEKNFLHFLLYISFFPRFLSGPIDRSNEFLPQLKTRQSFDEDNVVEGLRLLLIGLFKKMVIANHLAITINSVYADVGASNDYALWVILLIQPLYLYFDFYAYTDIAFGIARTFGIKLRPNFNRPFMAESVTMFWKRFHMSLASWFHDYVFMRFLFKYRKLSKHVTSFALLLTWTLFGIWHGAGWNFMLLGLLQALAMYYEFRTKKWRIKTLSKLPDFYRKWVGRILTYLFYGISLVFFFSPDLNSVSVFFSRLFKYEHIWTQGILDDLFVFAWVTAILLFEIIQTDYGKAYSKIEASWTNWISGNRWARWAIYLLIIMLIKHFNFSNPQFIYFQF